MNNHYYVYLSSEKDESVYPNNKAHDFFTQLSPPMVLEPEQEWSVAVTELELTPGTGQPFCLCSDVCEGSYVNGKILPVLRKFYPLAAGVKQVFTFTKPYYMNAKLEFVNSLRVYITDATGEELSFDDKTLKCTLHFRRSSPWYSN